MKKRMCDSDTSEQDTGQVVEMKFQSQTDPCQKAWEEEMITLTAVEYQNLKTRLQAIYNLNALLYEKDQKLKDEVERSKRYENAYMRAEEKLGIFVKQALTMRAPQMPVEHNYASAGSIEDDLTTDGIDSLSTVEQKGDKFENQEDLSSLRPLVVPTVSKSLFDKLIQENCRLKRTLTDAVHRDGGKDVQTYLDIREYEDIVQQLRTELSSKNQFLTQLEKVSKASGGGGEGDHVAIVADLQNKILRLEKMANAKQTLVETFGKECERLKQENLKLQSEGAQLEVALAQKERNGDFDGGSHLSSAQEQRDDREVTLHDLATNYEEVKKWKEENEQLKQQLENLAQKYDVEVRELNTSLRQVCEENRVLRQEAADQDNQEAGPSIVQDLQSAVEDLRQQLEKKNMQLKQMTTELQIAKHNEQTWREAKELLEQQCKYFEVDFTKEKKDREREVIEFRRCKKLMEDQLDKFREENHHLHRLLQDKTQACTKLEYLLKSGQQSVIRNDHQLKQREAPWTQPGFNRLQEKVVQDGPISDVEDLGQAAAAAASTPPGLRQPLECPRCMRKFDNRQKFDDHLRKCTS